MAFVVDWQKKLGYKHDPFTAVPKRASEFFVAREEEREACNLFVIKQHRFGMVVGAKELGKTALLDWLAEQLAAHHKKVKVVRVDDPKVLGNHKDAFEHFLEHALNIVERTVTRPHEKVAPQEREEFLLGKINARRFLFLVEGALSKEGRELLQRVMAACPGVQVVLAVERALKEHESYGEDKLRVELKPFAEDELRALLERRLALAGGVGLHPFTDEELAAIAKKSKGNPRQFLSSARERAIELSLKAGPPPKPEPEAPKPREERAAKPAEASVEEPPTPKRRWFSVKFVEKHKKRAAPAETIDEEILAPSDQAAIDADLLRELVGEEPEEKRAEADEIVHEIVEDLKR